MLAQAHRIGEAAEQDRDSGVMRLELSPKRHEIARRGLTLVRGKLRVDLSLLSDRLRRYRRRAWPVEGNSP